MTPFAPPLRRAPPAALILLTLVCAACAGGPQRASDGPRARPPAARLFVSPFGEVFMAEPDQPWPVSDWFLGADADLDGALTFAEFEADGGRVFAALDGDRSGRLEQAELAAYESRLRGLGGPPGLSPRSGDRPPLSRFLADGSPQSGPPRGGRMGGPPRGGLRGPRGYGVVAEAGFFNLPQPVKAADVNVDQRVTVEEWASATRRWFLALDRDNDGGLALATLPKTPLQARVERL